MKLNLSLVLLLLPILIFADLMWQENGIPIRQGNNIRNYRSVTLTDNSIINIWNDNRNGIKAIYGQILDLEGNQLWEDQGLELHSSDSMQLINNIIPTSDNGFIVLWKDYAVNNINDFTYKGQKYTSQGIASWGVNGLEIPYSSSNTILSDNSGGFYYIYHANQSLVCFRYTADGEVSMGWESGITIENEYFGYIATVTNNSTLFVAIEESYSFFRIFNLSPSGTHLWSDQGLTISSPDQISGNYSKAIVTQSDNIFLAWRAYNVENPGRFYVQHIDTEGNQSWDAPVLIQTESNNSKFDIDLNENNELILPIWNYTRADIFKVNEIGDQPWGDNGHSIIEYNVNSHIEKLDFNITEEDEYQIVWSKNSGDFKKFYYQKCNEDGELLYNTPGNLIHECNFRGGLPEVTFAANHPFLSWIEYIGSEQFLKTQLLNSEGEEQWDEAGIGITTGIGGSSLNPKLLFAENIPVVLWRDNRSYSSYDMYMQTLSSDGENQNQPNGLKIIYETEFGYGGYASVVGKNSDLITTLWLEKSEDYYQVFFEQFDLQGNTSWGDSCGIPISDLQYRYATPMIYCNDNNGNDEFYCAWVKESLSYGHHYDVVAQKVVNGIPQWEDGITLDSCDEFTSTPFYLEDVVDRFFLWTKGDYTERALKVSYLNEYGYSMPGWPGDGLVIDDFIGYYPQIQSAIIDEGLFIVWRDETSESQRDIKGQIIDWSGDFLWESEGRILVSDVGSSVFTALVEDEIILTWTQPSPNDGNPVKIQKFNFNGEEIWQEGGITIYHTNNNYGMSSTLDKIDDKILTIFEYEDDSDSYTNLKAQVIDAQGELLYPEGGITLVEEYMIQTGPQVEINDDYAYIIWKDFRSTYFDAQFGLYENIYAQKLDLTNLASPEDVVKPNSVNLSNYPNPFNPTTTISFSLNTESTEDTELEIFNVKGQKIKSFVCHPEPYEGSSSTFSTTWNGTDSQNNPVSSGIYFINLKSADRNLSQKKCLLLK